MRKNLKYLILIALLSSCKGKDKIPTPVSYKIYCWSFFSCKDTVSPFTLTNTLIRVKPSEIMENKYLLIKDSDLVKSLSLYNLLLKGHKIKENAVNGTDARFVIELNYKEKKSDTLIYYADSSFCLNDKHSIHYDFRILDSVRKYVNVKCFECKFP